MNEELNQVKSFSEYELVEYLQNGLLSRVTGGEFNDEIYKFIRLEMKRVPR